MMPYIILNIQGVWKYRCSICACKLICVRKTSFTSTCITSISPGPLYIKYDVAVVGALLSRKTMISDVGVNLCTAYCGCVDQFWSKRACCSSYLCSPRRSWWVCVCIPSYAYTSFFSSSFPLLLYGLSNGIDGELLVPSAGVAFRLPGAIPPTLRFPFALIFGTEDGCNFLPGNQRLARCTGYLLESCRPDTRAPSSTAVFSRVSQTCCSFLFARGHLCWGHDPVM